MAVRFRLLNFVMVIVMAAGLVVTADPPSSVNAVSTTLVISQFQTSGDGGAGDEFIEIHNVSSGPINLSGYQLMYRAATGTTDIILLTFGSVNITAGGYYLAANSQYNEAGIPRDVAFSGGLAAAGAGIAIYDPSSTIIDSLGYGSATNAFVEGIRMSAPGTNDSQSRLTNGCTDTDNNSIDFSLTPPSAPRNASSTEVICSPPDTPPTVSSTDPPDNAEDVATTANITVEFSENVAITPASFFDITCGGVKQTGTVSGGESTYTIDPTSDLPQFSSCEVTIYAEAVVDQDGSEDTMAADYLWDFTIGEDAAPDVMSVNPPNAATDIAWDADIVVVFTEPVAVNETWWYDITCDESYVHTAVTSGGPTTFTLNPNTDFSNGEECNVMVLASYVTDLDVNDDPNEMASNYAWYFTALSLDDPPEVESTVPGNGDEDVAVDATITVNFTESVITSGTWASLVCGVASVPVTLSGSGMAYTVDPDDSLPYGASCTATIDASAVVDEDYAPDNMLSDYIWSFTTTFCGAPHTPISTVQGSGASSPLLGSVVVVEGIVTADLQGSNPGMNGFYIQSQTSDEDADPLTSEGVMVYDNSIAASLGDILRVQGTVTEYENLTELGSASLIESCGTGTIPSPVVVDLPDTADETFTLEPYEGMLVTIPETLTVQQNYFQARFGQVTLGAGGRIAHMHNITRDGGSPYEYTRMIILDDANTRQNVNPTAYYGVDDFMRAGDTVPGVTGIVDQGAINSTSSPYVFPYNYYRLQPTVVPSFTRDNPRPVTSSDVGGTLKVVGFNTLNYFTTLDMAPYRTTPPYDGTNTPRGADTVYEFTRQKAKLVVALVAMDADVYGLLELESWDTAAAPQALVDALNTYLVAHGSTDTYAAVPDPVPGHFDIMTDSDSDYIQVGLIYKTQTVSLVGDSLSVDDTIFERSPFAQVFEEIATGEQFVVVANHFKSKGCMDATGDDLDQEDGQGCYNARRVLQAEALLDFIDTTLTPLDPDVMVIGDLNAYGAEDPVKTLIDGGLVNQIAASVPEEERYSFVFDGAAGYLDHFLSTAHMAYQIAGVDFFHINADEISFIDYNMEYKGGSYSPDLCQPHMYRSSDHDPVVVGLLLRKLKYWLPVIIN